MAPIYESSVILKASLKRPELRETLKRVSHYVLDRSGIIHSMENLGTRALPHKMRSDQGKTSTGSYFILKYAVPADASNEINDSLVADVDVLRHGTMKLDTLAEHKPPDCTLAEEIRPPAYRPDVVDKFQPMQGRAPIPPDVYKKLYEDIS